MVTHSSSARPGFSLMEILIALLIVGIMAAVGGYALQGYLSRAAKTSTKTTLKVLKNAIMLYEADTGRLPASLRDLAKQPRDEKVAKKWEGPYIQGDSLPLDGYKKKFIYKPESDGTHPYQLYSFGPNGKGAPKSEWISVWDK
jgi:general secretion pathway protein G